MIIRWNTQNTVLVEVFHRNSEWMYNGDIWQQNSENFVENQQEKVLEMFRGPARIINWQITRRVKEHLTQQNSADEEVRVDWKRSIFEDQVDDPIRVFLFDIL